MTKRRALFLDRDGVINVDHAYVSKKDDFEFIDGIFQLCREAKRRDYMLIVITNQAGIARGYYSERDFLFLTNWMKDIFLAEGCELDAVYYSPYHPNYGIGEYKRQSDCRKPQPGMILRAASEFHVDLGRSVLIGDKDTDIKAGINAGVGCNLLFSPPPREQDHVSVIGPAATVTSLVDAINYLL